MQPSAPASAECFALLDDSSAQAGQARTRLYTDLAQQLLLDRASDLDRLFAQMQQGLRDGLHAVGLFEYELGARMHGVHADTPCDRPLARVLLFRQCRRLSGDEAGQWLQQRDDGAPAGVANVQATVDAARFEADIARIHRYIESGDTYQVNYTYRLRFDAYGNPLALYRRLRARQPVPYGALIALPDGAAVLSLSPELFVRQCDGRLIAQPMKGTAPASGDPIEDARRAAALAADIKNRAENLMIVDLLRNDLGRVARCGSVRVPHLFQVERFSGVLQMTSTVEAEPRADCTLAEIFAALFPCGSVTGAPKRRTMQIIDELEPHRRGLYTGAIGWFDAPAPEQALGDFCLSVPIRTLLLQPPNGNVRAGELGVGAGIVHDSVAAGEFAECALKARFLTGLPHAFSLIETMHAGPDGCRHLELHLRRLRASAACFGFPFDEPAIRAELRQACAPLAAARRLRLTLHSDGRREIATAALTALSQPVRVLLAARPTHSGDPFLRHKTSVRARYDAAWQEAERHGAFDMLFFNERDELTEGARSNVFLRLDGRWLTPPLAAGILPGVMRAALLADPGWNAQECTLTLADLERAEAVVVCNALRGALRAEVRRELTRSD